MSYKLRPYQQRCADKAVKYLKSKSKYNGIIILPTGSGKSLVIADVARQLDDHVLVLQPNKEILEQNLNKYLSYGNYASVFSASLNQKKISKVTFGTIGSVINKWEAFDHFQYVIVDECHYVNPKKGMYKKLFDRIKVKVLGLTATPYRLNTDGYGGSMLKFITRTRPRVFKDIIDYVQVKDLSRAGYLAPVEYMNDDVFDSNKIKKNSTGADYDEAALKMYWKHIGQDDRTVYAIRAHRDRRSILAFTPYVENAEYVASQVMGARIVHAKTPKKERAKLVDDFRSGRVQVVVNVGILGIGFDYPELDTVIMSRPTMSLALYYQQIGRAIRPHPEKASALVVDLTDNYKKFGKIEDITLVPAGKKPFIMANGRQITNVYFDEFGTTEFDTATMPFGKHEGKFLRDIDVGYLEWLRDNCDLYDPLKSAVNYHLNNCQIEMDSSQLRRM